MASPSYENAVKSVSTKPKSDVKKSNRLKPALPETEEQIIEKLIEHEAVGRFGRVDAPEILSVDNPLRIGDEVYCGALKNAVVVRVFDEGRKIVIKSEGAPSREAVNSGANSEFNSENNEPRHYYLVSSSIDVQKKCDEQKTSFATPDQVEAQFSQRDVGSLINMVIHFGVDTQPEYQRNLVWSVADKEALIDSIFNHCDIGKFLFVHKEYAANTPSYEVVDGKQRLMTLMEFMHDKFEHKGVLWSQMGQRDRHYLDNYPIAVGIVEERHLKPGDKLRMFLRLNTGGHVVAKEHIDLVRQQLAQVEGATTKKPSPEVKVEEAVVPNKRTRP